MKVFAAILLYGIATLPVQAVTPAPAYSVLHDFDGVSGSNPSSEVTVGSDGSLYGTTLSGGTNDLGTVFKIDPFGIYKVLYNFEYTANSGISYSSISLDGNNNLYGTVSTGGDYEQGFIYKINSTGSFSVLHSFLDGGYPEAAVTLAKDGTLYGTYDKAGVYKISPSGVFSVLFNGFYEDGGINYKSEVTLTKDGSLFGTSSYVANDDGVGTVYKIDSKGNYSVFYAFSNPGDGTILPYSPTSRVVFDSEGNLYGTTFHGFIYKISPSGEFSVLYQFYNLPNLSGVTLFSDGKLYGTTSSYDGVNSNGNSTFSGTVYRIDTTGGNFSVLHNFDSINTTNGMPFFSRVTQANDGSLYGTTDYGGTYNHGVIYRLTLPNSNVPGDLSGDGKVNCADIKIVKASFGKRLGQSGFDARADIVHDNVINLRDLVFVSRKLPSGLLCN